jgi:hypothetical protein
MKNTDTQRFIKKKTCRHLNVCHCCNFEEKPLSSSLKTRWPLLKEKLGNFCFSLPFFSKFSRLWGNGI